MPEYGFLLENKKTKKVFVQPHKSQVCLNWMRSAGPFNKIDKKRFNLIGVVSNIGGKTIKSRNEWLSFLMKVSFIKDYVHVHDEYIILPFNQSMRENLWGYSAIRNIFQFNIYAERAMKWHSWGLTPEMAFLMSHYYEYSTEREHFARTHYSTGHHPLPELPIPHHMESRVWKMLPIIAQDRAWSESWGDFKECHSFISKNTPPRQSLPQYIKWDFRSGKPTKEMSEWFGR